MARKLLLADDSVTIQKVVGISFANEDVELMTVDNGDDALARARESRPDLVLADVVMPGKNGYEVCEAIKADPQLAGVPVLLLTGTFEAFDEDRARAAGADGHITKPFEAQALVDRVNALLARASAAPPAAAPEAPAPAADEDLPVQRPAGPAAAAPPAADAATSLRDSTDPLAAPGVADPLADSGAELGSAGDDGFDFFEDDLGDAAASSEAQASSEAAATAFELDAGESAFDFAPLADEGRAAGGPGPGSPAPDATVVAPPPAAPGPAPAAPRPDATVVMPAPGGSEDDWPSPADLDAAFDGGDLGEDHSGPDLESADPDAAPGEHPVTPDQPTVLQLEDEAPPEDDGDALDFGPVPAGEAADDGDDFLGGFGAGEASREAVSDPDHGGDFAVSSSDLGDPLDLGPAEPAEEPGEGEALEEAVLAASEDGEPVLGEPDGVLGSSFQEPAAPPAAERAPAAAAREAGPDLTPMMRERVHEALEKVAWEAFADLPEQIVRQALAKVEEIAWEVIPQMAEALIREEIRRMKGETE